MQQAQHRPDKIRFGPLYVIPDKRSRKKAKKSQARNKKRAERFKEDKYVIS